MKNILIYAFIYVVYNICTFQITWMVILWSVISVQFQWSLLNVFLIQKRILWLFLNNFLTEKCNAKETIQQKFTSYKVCHGFYTLFIFTWMYCSFWSLFAISRFFFLFFQGHILIISNIVLASLQSFVNDMLLVTTLWLPFCMLSSSDNLSEDFL